MPADMPPMTLGDAPAARRSVRQFSPRPVERGLIEEVIGRGWTINTAPSAPKLRWTVENEPDLLQRTDTFLLVKDFVRLGLTGTAATDPSDAVGTCLYDEGRGDWSRPLLEAIGVPLEKMPPIHQK